MSKTEKKTVDKSEYQKKYYPEWYKKNRDKHLAYMNQTVYCDCGSKIVRVGLARHMRSQKHQRWEKNNEPKNFMIKCPCGGFYEKDNKAKHILGKMHQNYLKID